jgi:hypothetical protein
MQIFQILNNRIALSLCSIATIRIGLTQSPLKPSAALMVLLLHSHRRMKASFMRLFECKYFKY